MINISKARQLSFQTPWKMLLLKIFIIKLLSCKRFTEKNLLALWLAIATTFSMNEENQRYHLQFFFSIVNTLSFFLNLYNSNSHILVDTGECTFNLRPVPRGIHLKILSILTSLKVTQ